MSAADINRDLGRLAPLFRTAVEAALAECATRGLDASVYEGFRTRERQEALYAQGRTTPGEIVTNATSALYSWHGFGLAADVISRAHRWDRPEAWWRAVGETFERHGCTWGGRWQMHDTPHMQWGRCRISPSARARELYVARGLQGVWEEVGAAAAPPPAEVMVPPYTPKVLVPPAHRDIVPAHLAHVLPK